MDVFAVPGTTEPASRDGRVLGMLSNITAHLDPKKFRSFQVNYPASYGAFLPFPNSPDFSVSVEQGVTALVAAIRATENIAVLIGYSQGSTVITRLLERIERGEFADLEIAGVVLVANPMRALGDSVDITAPGYGISGEHDDFPDHIPVWEIAHPKDPITSLSKSSPLRSFGDVTRKFSITNPLAWLADVNQIIVTQGFQRWWDQPAKNRWGNVLAEVTRYPYWHLAYGADRHPFPGTNKSYCHKAATILNERL